MNSFVPTAVESIIGLELAEIRLLVLNVFCTVWVILSWVNLNYFPGRKMIRSGSLKGNVVDIFKCFVVYIKAGCLKWTCCITFYAVALTVV